ncbi:MAG: 14-3-3 family protein, partial [Gammaproteobacteria bacterium]|nr:14-3-3 family protein [Gammaproteobacteria bacterium]
AERYEDMSKAIKAVVELKDEFGAEERKLLSSAYKSLAVALRSSYRTLTGIEQKTEESDTSKLKMTKEYKEEIGTELKNLCKDVLRLIQEFLLPGTPEADHESRAFYKKMQGDYNRYLAEVQEDGDFKSESLAAYGEAYDIVKQNMPATNLTRLGRDVTRLPSDQYHDVCFRSGSQLQCLSLRNHEFPGRSPKSGQDGLR